MDVALREWLLLSQWPGLPRRALLRLLAQAKTPADIFALTDEACLYAGASPAWLSARQRHLAGAPTPESERVDSQIEALAALKAELIDFHHPRYPALLKEIPDPPPLLYVAGDLDLLEQPQLAVVGSRKASRGGLDLAHSFAADLAGRGLCITSGLAYGVDAASHWGALKAGGKTIGVLGTGLDVVYPRRNAELYQTVLEKGLLVSEFPPGSPPRREQFPQRNRVISGLSLGVLVVEAAVRSGSLITARFALEQGREVFAIPGSIHNPQARGCHKLIREGACLVESSQDILDAWVGWLPPALQTLDSDAAANEPPLSTERQQLLAGIGFDPLPLDRLAEQCQLAIDELLPELLNLELEGWVEQQGACWVRCR